MSKIIINMNSNNSCEVTNEDFLYKMIVEKFDTFSKNSHGGIVLDLCNDLGDLEKILIIGSDTNLGIYLHYGVIEERLVKKIYMVMKN